MLTILVACAVVGAVGGWVVDRIGRRAAINAAHHRRHMRAHERAIRASKARAEKLAAWRKAVGR